MTRKRVQELIEQSVTAGTLQQYKTRIDKLKEFLRRKDQHNDLNIENFAEFLDDLWSRTKNNSRSTAEGYRAAILFHQRTYRMWLTDGFAWADSWECRRMTAGFGYQQKTSGRPQRGQVTAEMFAAMITKARQHYPTFAPALELSYRLALRPHQVIGLRNGDYNGDTLTIPDKRSRAQNKFPQFTKKKVIDEEARFILQALQETRPGVFFPFTMAALRNVFKSIAAMLGWPKLQQKYDGTHCLRHGGMAHLDDMLEMSREEANKILQVSESTRRRYTKPNKERV